MKNKFDLIIFDWDGTLINSIDWITNCLQQAAAQCDCAIPESQVAKDVIGLSIKKAMQALQATETEDLFRITRCADETASKPDPRMLHEIIQHTNAAKERTLMVGDSIHDLQMALNAHISAIAVSCGAHSEEFLQQYNPLLCLQQPTELLNII